MTSRERIFALCQAIRYVSHNQIEGDIVECGVWRGGSMMAAIETLLSIHDKGRHLYLFDTFEGMSEPTENDFSFYGDNAQTLLTKNEKNEENYTWCYAALESVQQNLSQLNYDSNKIHFIKGKVEDTLPKHSPEKIALLRLDTDWYESTRHELIHLFPRLSVGGVIIIDDYGYWKGARKAVDEYFKENNIPILLHRIDHTGRIGIVLNSNS
ncbi:MAG: TylF/MycF/NovP-related O-methyltransferase [Microcystaceae cyanobacterium]